MNDVPFTGAAAARGGRCRAARSTRRVFWVATVLQHVKAGKLRVVVHRGNSKLEPPAGRAGAQGRGPSMLKNADWLYVCTGRACQSPSCSGLRAEPGAAANDPKGHAGHPQRWEPYSLTRTCLFREHAQADVKRMADVVKKIGKERVTVGEIDVVTHCLFPLGGVGLDDVFATPCGPGDPQLFGLVSRRSSPLWSCSRATPGFFQSRRRSRWSRALLHREKPGASCYWHRHRRQGRRDGDMSLPMFMSYRWVKTCRPEAVPRPRWDLAASCSSTISGTWRLVGLFDRCWRGTSRSCSNWRRSRPVKSELCILWGGGTLNQMAGELVQVDVGGTWCRSGSAQVRPRVLTRRPARWN